MSDTCALIFTDLDGTLLDHDNYSFSAADASLQQLAQQNTPVIPNTSKTYAELQSLREALALNTPFVVENGAAIYIPVAFFPKKPPQTQLVEGYWVKQFTLPRSHWIRLLKQSAGAFSECYQGFSSLSTEQLQALTGLSLTAAEQAGQRQFGEPLHWLGTEAQKQDFVQLMTERGANVLEGGRFIHISGTCDKGSAMHWLTQEFARQYPEQSFYNIALGDSQNDNAMLEAADIAVQIKSPKHDFLPLNRSDNLYQSQQLGPAGWHEVIQQLLFSEFSPRKGRQTDTGRNSH